MSIHNNFPAPSWIKLDGISVTKGDEVHIVSDFKTNLKYIYWTSDNPKQLTASNVMLNRTATRFLIVVNNKGECVLVPNKDISVSFDGNSVGAITEHIWGLYEKDEEYGNRFVSVEQNIEGLTTTVGQTKEEFNSVKEQISKIDQKADSIDLSVKELNKEYNDDKEITALREEVNKSIININSTLGLFKSKITEIFKDNEISENEAVAIQAQIDILEEKKTGVINQVDRVIALIEAEDKSEEVINLTSQKQAFVNAIDNVILLVNTAISDGIIVPTDITIVTDGFAKASLEVNILKNTLDDIILLGTGGTISEELARIGMKSDEIVLSVQKVEETVENDMAYVKEELVGQIQDVTNVVNNLEETMNGSFLDGVLSDSEKIVFKNNLEALATEKLDIDKQYEAIYNNPDLINEPKTSLKTAYDNYIQKYNELVNSINIVINKEGNIDINDQSNINSCIVAHRNALGELSTKMSKSIDSIAGNKVTTVDKKYSEILLTPDGIVSRVGKVESKADENGNRLETAESKIEQLSDKIVSSVTVGDVKSIIEQSPEEIKYGFNDISDYVTIGTYGLDVNRGRIACDSITSSSVNPVIKLFEGNGLRCEIDASDYFGQGIGTAIRLKRDDNNYVYVGGGSIALYVSGSSTNNSPLCSFSGTSNSLKINSKGGTLELNNGLRYGGSRVSMEGHSHSDYANYSHRHSGENWGELGLGNLYVNYMGYKDAGSEWAVQCTSHFASPNSNRYLGVSAMRWQGAYLYNNPNVSSDRKLKENIVYVQEESVPNNTPQAEDNKGNSNENALSINQMHSFIKNDLRLAEYDYINLEANKNKEISEEDKKRDNYVDSDSLRNRQIGFIAQDIVDTEVGSKIVTKHEDGILGYETGNFTAVIAGAIKEEIKQREDEITKLKEEVKELKDSINSLIEKFNTLTK